MHTEEILQRITKPFIMAGIYKDEQTALIDITLDYVCRKIEQYDNLIISLNIIILKIFSIDCQIYILQKIWSIEPT